MTKPPLTERYRSGRPGLEAAISFYNQIPEKRGDYPGKNLSFFRLAQTGNNSGPQMFSLFQ
jgi:hypothetical protein